ncbi:SMC-Scp complex subunit ScpB [Litoribrevibacter albus]|uniref:SMC-Scp complex subunit ScpB n=1 Tax=Litoribrevibacter albus TaxID=1473156 RepID=A0AA37S8Y8_9GAMM|nr:SMC-Scp complex subunit ScpB [Litoribrevibacter albus]GLQ30773.1 hypothetical protein GCM10007876_12520 [Litoribrevibacter albus]
MTNKISAKLLEQIIEGALLVSGKAISVSDVKGYFGEDDVVPHHSDIRAAFQKLVKRYKARGIELKEVASGYRFQVAEQVAPYVIKQWEEKPQRYSRALLETLALIAYRQPITRGDIEDIRGVSVSSNIVRTLLEREWVRVVGHKDVPGRPALYATTSKFLDYFNLKSLTELPELSEVRDLEQINPELDFGDEYLPSAPMEQVDQGAEFDGESADMIPDTEEPVDVALDEASLADKEEVRLAKEMAQKEKELQQEMAAREELTDIDRFNKAFEKMIRSPEAQRGQVVSSGVGTDSTDGSGVVDADGNQQADELPGWWTQAQADAEPEHQDVSEFQSMEPEKSVASRSRFAQLADRLELSVQEVEQQELLVQEADDELSEYENHGSVEASDLEVSGVSGFETGASDDEMSTALHQVEVVEPNNEDAEVKLTERTFGQKISGDEMSEADIERLIQQKLAEQAALLNQRPSEQDSEDESE